MANHHSWKLAMAATAVFWMSITGAMAQQVPASQPATAGSQPATAGSQPATASAVRGGLVSNVFVDTDLRQAISDLAAQANVVIAMDPSVGGLVTCTLDEVALDQALEILLAGTGFVVNKTPDYYLVCSSDPKSPAFSMISGTRVVKLNYAKASAAMKLVSPAFRGYVQAADESNTLCVTASPALMERILADISQFDAPPQHVLLEARIMVLENADLLDLGIQWTWPRVLAGTFSDSDHHGGGLTPSWPWGIRIGYTPGADFTSALALSLDFLSQNGQATLIACPQVMAQDGESAEMKVNTEEYFEIVSEGLYVTSNLQKIETGTMLQMVPRIGRDGTITLAMTTEVSDVVARGENDYPVISRRTASSTIRVQDGGTAVIAGLLDKKDESVQSRLPGLWRIPVFGYLGRRENSRSTSRQVAVFVTARLLQDLQAGTETPGGPPEPLAAADVDEFRLAIRRSLATDGTGK